MWSSCSPLPELWIAAYFLSQVNQVGMRVTLTFLPYQGVGQVGSKGSVSSAIMQDTSGPSNAEFLVNSVRECSQNLGLLPYSQFIPRDPHGVACLQAHKSSRLPRMGPAIAPAGCKSRRKRRGTREKGLAQGDRISQGNKRDPERGALRTHYTFLVPVLTSQIDSSL